MGAPSNVTPGTAIAATPLPYAVTQNVNDSGTTYTVYYKYTAIAGDVEIGVWGFGGVLAAGSYRPAVSVVDVSGTPIDFDGNEIQGINVPIQIPVTVGTTYYLKVVSNTGNVAVASLALNVQRFTNQFVPSGMMLATTDVGSGFAWCVIDPATANTPLQFMHPFANGEAIGQLADGTFCTEHFDNLAVEIWSASGTFVATVASDPASSCSVTQQGEHFYVGLPDDSHILQVSSTGATLQTITTTNWLDDLAVSPDETIVYTLEQGTDVPIRRYSLATGLPLSDLVAGIPNYSTPGGEGHHMLLCLADGTVVASYYRYTAGIWIDGFVRRYSAAGATLGTYTLPRQYQGSQIHLAQDWAAPGTFWLVVYIEPPTLSGQIIIKKIDAASMTQLGTNVAYTGFNVGHSSQTPAVTMTRFGPEYVSATFFILRNSFPPVTNGTGDPIRVQRRFLLPSETNLQMFLSRLELLAQMGVGLTAGPSGSPVQGQDPQVMLRLSRDGGITWGNEMWRSLGALGNYTNRAIWNRLGRGRQLVVELTISDPVFVGWLDAFATLEQGTS